MSWISVVVVMAAAVVGTLEGPPAEKRLKDLAWMAGTWKGESEGVSMEETWTEPGGGMMLGLHRDVKGGRVSSWEFLRIEEGTEGIVYQASPRGAPPTPFKVVELAAERVVFANPAHDFPKRILYWRAKDGALHARVDGGEGSKGFEWRWTRSK